MVEAVDPLIQYQVTLQCLSDLTLQWVPDPILLTCFLYCHYIAAGYSGTGAAAMQVDTGSAVVTSTAAAQASDRGARAVATLRSKLPTIVKAAQKQVRS